MTVETRVQRRQWRDAIEVIDDMLVGAWSPALTGLARTQALVVRQVFTARLETPRAPTLDITGERHGTLVAVENTGERVPRGFLWRLLCDCGRWRTEPAGSFRTGRIRGCRACARARQGPRRRSVQRES